MSLLSSSFFSLFRQAVDTPSDVVCLAEKIRALGHRLAHPEEQSDYFRWGLENHSREFERLCREYQGMRHWYVMHTVDDILEQRAQHLQKAKALFAGEMNMGRALMLHAANAQIAWLDECLRLKEAKVELPEPGELLHGLGHPDMR
jgi:hypothetical protein